VSSPARGTRLPFAVRIDTQAGQKQAIVTSGLGPDDRLWVTAAGVEVLDQDG
jgi:hypothetical protein